MTDPEQNPTEQWIEQGRALRKTVKRSDHLALGHLHRDPVALLQATDLERATAARPHDALALAEQGTGQARLEALTDPLLAASSTSKPTTKPVGVYLIGNWNNNLHN